MIPEWNNDTYINHESRSEEIRLMQLHPNLSINLSGAVWTYNYALHEWAQRFGADRIFFGSGYPFCNPAGKLAAVRWELRDQPDSVCERILCRNALSLLGAEGRL